jgi:hypothetical protein
MIPHDKHQYYFEKYLRNEMSYHERMAFDEKLAEDEALNQAFVFYRANREVMLKNLIEEHKLDRRDGRLNKLIFLLISLTGIALTFNYYFYKAPAQRSGKQTPQKQREPLYTYIPFVNWEKRSEKNQPKKDTATPPPAQVKTRQQPADDSIVVLEPSTRDDERTANDVFLTDTFISVYEQAYIRSLIASRKKAADHHHPADHHDQDSVATHKPAKPEKHGQLFVEFWQSPVKYRGYLFNGKKLIIYGVRSPFEIYIYKHDDTFEMLYASEEIPLIPQPNFQAF